MCLLSFLKWSSIGYFLGIVQWDSTRRNHPGNSGRVSGSGLVSLVSELWVSKYLGVVHCCATHPVFIYLPNLVLEIDYVSFIIGNSSSF